MMTPARRDWDIDPLVNQDILWEPWSEPGLEHLRLVGAGRELVADGLVLRVEGGTPFRARYHVRCDAANRVRAVEIRMIDDSARAVVLRADGAGGWTDEQGHAVRGLDGCLDIDISATPFTNTLPIRRLALEQGRAAEIMVAYIAVPDLALSARQQRYTCLERSVADGRYGGRYRYEGPIGEFSAELRVDVDGLVVEYTEGFRRIWTTHHPADRARQDSRRHVV